MSPKVLAGAPTLPQPRLGNPRWHRVFATLSLSDQVVSSASLAPVHKSLALGADHHLIATSARADGGLGRSPSVFARLRSGTQFGRRRRQARRPHQSAQRRRSPSFPSSSTRCASLRATHTIYSLYHTPRRRVPCMSLLLVLCKHQVHAAAERHRQMHDVPHFPTGGNLTPSPLHPRGHHRRLGAWQTSPTADHQLGEPLQPPRPHVLPSVSPFGIL